MLLGSDRREVLRRLLVLENTWIHYARVGGGVTYKYVDVGCGFNRRCFLIPYFMHVLQTKRYQLRWVFTSWIEKGYISFIQNLHIRVFYALNPCDMENLHLVNCPRCYVALGMELHVTKATKGRSGTSPTLTNGHHMSANGVVVMNLVIKKHIWRL